MASFLPVFFHDQYHITKIVAGDLTTIVVLSGSFLRPVGGWLGGPLRRLSPASDPLLMHRVGTHAGQHAARR